MPLASDSHGFQSVNSFRPPESFCADGHPRAHFLGARPTFDAADKKKKKRQTEKQAEKQTLENIHRFKQELESEKQCHMKLFTQYKEWQLKEQERISKLKINVPEALQETYDRLSRLEE